MSASSWSGMACPAPPSANELAAIRGGSDEVAAALIGAWEPIIKKTANRRSTCPATREEVEQTGRVAVWHAARRFDSTRGYPFSHYAARSIANESRKTAAKRSRDGVTELSAAMGQQVSGLSAATCLAVREWLNELPRLLQKVFVVLYRRGHSQREAARRLRVSQPRVSQLHRELLERGLSDLAGVAQPREV